MANILNIETSGRHASICVADNNVTKAVRYNKNLQDHAAWLHVAIQDALNEIQWELKNLDAIAISEGPGSYTGLRMGMAAAKGICYALQIPLISVPTLSVVAKAAMDEGASADFWIPMIDARRMEVYSAVYNNQLELLLPPQALILDNNSLQDWRRKGVLLICGDGAAKSASIWQDAHVIIQPTEATAESMKTLSLDLYQQNVFTDLAYSEPFYLKEFYSHGK